MSCFCPATLTGYSLVAWVKDGPTSAIKLTTCTNHSGILSAFRGIDQLHLAVLHPKKLAVYSVSGKLEKIRQVRSEVQDLPSLIASLSS